jgi:pyruvate/2-oxoglutarate dehydrogenase complex dihydrolipoamide dehydrogenase (E3) component
LLVPLEQVDRARLDGDEGLLKVHVRKGTDRVVGATLVARDAGNIIAGLTLAIGAGIGLKRLAEAIHPYPTQAEALKRAADAFNRARVAPRLRALSERILAWRR